MITARLYGISLVGFTFFSATGTFVSSVVDTMITPLGAIFYIEDFMPEKH
jgi:hypothetical protein